MTFEMKCTDTLHFLKKFLIITNGLGASNPVLVNRDAINFDDNETTKA